MHSQLFKKCTTQLLCKKPTQELRFRAAVSKKRKQVKKRGPRKPAFNSHDNIYIRKPYKAKMMAPPPAAGADAAWSENLNLSAICKDCKEVPPNLVEEFSSGDLVCGSCGLVIGDRIVDTRSEWRTFANDDQGNDDPSRVGDGANPLLNGSQLSTSIAFGENRSGHDLHRAHGRANADKSTKDLLQAYQAIGYHCEAIGIAKNVADTAKHLYKMVDDKKAAKGKSQDAIVAGCIFIACRQCGVGRTFREIYALTKVSKKDIGKTFKMLEKFFLDQPKDTNKGKMVWLLFYLLYCINPSLKVFLHQPMHTRQLPRPALETFVSVTAVNLVSRTNSLSRFRKVSQKRFLRSSISPVDPLYPSLLPAYIWPRTYWASQNPQKISPQSPV